MSQIDVWHHSGRRNPATGVLISRDRPTIVFLTVCTLRRSATLARQIYHDALVEVWTEANAWLVGAYVTMPDHMHLFCAPKNEEIAIEQWIVFWKRQFRRKLGSAAPRFQSRGFHHRLRRDENYHHKWEYVRANPVRAGLVKSAEEMEVSGCVEPPALVRRRTSKRFVGSTESRPTSISTTALEAAVSGTPQIHVIRHMVTSVSRSHDSTPNSGTNVAKPFACYAAAAAIIWWGETQSSRRIRV